MDQSVSLLSLAPGERFVIEDIHAEEVVCNRFRAMGLLNGRVVQLMRFARFGGPIQIRVGSVNLIMRRREADCVKVSPLA